MKRNKSKEEFQVSLDKIGKLISDRGLQTSVFEYDTDKVIKFPKNNIVNKFFNTEQLSKNFDILIDSFKEYIPETVISQVEGKEVAIQNRIFNNHHLSSKEPIEVYSQLEEIYKNSEKLFKDKGIMVDLIGGESFWPFLLRYIFSLGNKEKANPTLSNILVDEKKGVYLTDFNSVISKFSQARSIKDIFIVIYAKIHFFIQKFYLRNFVTHT